MNKKELTEADIRIVALEQSNTTIFISDKVLVKAIRRLEQADYPGLADMLYRDLAGELVRADLGARRHA